MSAKECQPLDTFFSKPATKKMEMKDHSIKAKCDDNESVCVLSSSIGNDQFFFQYIGSSGVNTSVEMLPTRDDKVPLDSIISLQCSLQDAIVTFREVGLKSIIRRYIVKFSFA